MTDTPKRTPAEQKQVQDAAAFFKTLIKMVKKHQEMVTDVAVQQAALLQAVLERFPELAEPYERHRQASATDSPFVRDSRRIREEFDRLTAQVDED